jgi:hypothetical protein
MLTWKWLVKLFFALLCKPSLWISAIKQVFMLAKNRWSLVFPFLPFPSSDFMEFRLITYQGEVEKLPEVKVVIAWLSWVADLEKLKN